MTNLLLEEIAACNNHVIRDVFGQPVELIDPDGKKYTHSAENPEKLIMGMVQWESNAFNLKTGLEDMMQRPVVSISLSDLERVPISRLESGRMGWNIRIPESPLSDILVSYTLAGPPEKFTTLNFIKFKLQRVSQI